MTVKEEMHSWAKDLWPIARSLTGNGVRETLAYLKQLMPNLKIYNVPSGFRAFDWTVPNEWNIRDAYIADEFGNKIVNFLDNNLHVVGYSQPIDKWIDLDELENHLHSIVSQPDAIPYITSYYNPYWGFCLKHSQREKLKKGLYHVVIDSDLKPGILNYGEVIIPGNEDKEVFLSTYICHPSLANDNLSGMVLTAFLAKELLSRKKLNRSYRIIFVPETIGAIAYCAMNEKAMRKIEAGLVVATVGGPGSLGYKQSFNKDHYINRLIEEVFIEGEHDFVTYPFDIHGSDERQYSSQGFRVNVASLTKDKYYEYPYYHTSLDDLNFVQAEHIVKSLRLHQKVLAKLDAERTYRSLVSDCEVMLSKHDLYPVSGGAQTPGSDGATELDLILWLLWMCDGRSGTHGMARRLGVSTSRVLEILTQLEAKQVVERIA